LYLQGRIKKAETTAGDKFIQRIAAWSGSSQFKMIGRVLAQHAEGHWLISFIEWKWYNSQQKTIR
jgi:hypothetical protein